MFYKYHSMKNSIVFFYTNPYIISQIPLLADYHSGLGFDQAFQISLNHQRITIYNSDRSISENCLNGMKCLACFFARHSYPINKISHYNNTYYLSNKRYSNKVAIFNIHISFALTNIHFSFCGIVFFFMIRRKIFIINYIQNISFILISIKNPHMILLNCTLDMILVSNTLNKYFPYGINISSYKHGLIKTLERGAGYTNSCGSATSALGLIYNLQMSQTFQYHKYHETILIIWQGYNIFSTSPLSLYGYAHKVCDMSYDL